MKYFIIAGEASGDLHGSGLVKQLFLQDKDAKIQAWGGDKMIKAGADVKKHIKDLAFMGFVEVISNLKTILSNFKLCKSQIESFKPDVLILIDYPGFNLRIANWAKKNNLKVVYYISPQVWAWKKSRVKKIKRDVDKMLVILPFEEQFYAKYGMSVTFVGHPLVDAINDFRQNISGQAETAEKPILALLPGSREQEIKRILPQMLEAVEEFYETHRIVIAAVSVLPKEIYNIASEKIEFVFDDAYSLLSKAECALVTSGTATLETALFKVPLVVCYKANLISYFIAKKLVARNIKYISLVNLIAGKMVCKELIQNDLQKDKIVEELRKILPNQPRRNEMLAEFDELEKKLGTNGVANRVANEIIDFLNK
jgi:lipid-A-disaccharide synthase